MAALVASVSAQNNDQDLRSIAMLTIARQPMIPRCGKAGRRYVNRLRNEGLPQPGSNVPPGSNYVISATTDQQQGITWQSEEKNICRARVGGGERAAWRATPATRGSAQPMLNALRKARNVLEHRRTVRREDRMLSVLYAPDPNDLDRERHLAAAMDWLKRAQDSGTDRGVAYGARFGDDFDVSYPETTGYICRTFVEQSGLSGDSELLQRAIEMGDWEIAIQMPEGAVMGGKYTSQRTPAVFNTGMVLLGWSALIRSTGEPRFRDAARRASDWLLSIQEPDGSWIRGHSQFAIAGANLYNVYAASGLCEAGLALGDERYVKAAIHNAELCASRQHANGWFPNCCIENPQQPLLHALAYTMQGLIGIGKLTGRTDFIAAGRRAADAELRIMKEDGYLPGLQTRTFEAAADWCCLTGSAQTSIVWSELFALTGEDCYRHCARLVNRYLMARHDIRNPDLRMRGGLPGSWPVTGPYGRLTILNWATKYLVDALSLEAMAQQP